MEVLPHDLIEEILEKLSPKSLLRFKSVSKQWKSTIESLFFQHNHLIHHRQKSKNSDLLLINNDYKVNLQTLETLELETSISHNIPIPWKTNFFMLCQNSIDGLVCLYDIIYGSTIIFNPATRWYRILPPLTYQIQSSTELSKLGFGKDEINGLYKLVWLYNSANATLCEVFDFNTNTWRFVEPSSPKRINNWDSPVYLNGLLYWLTKNEEIKSVLSFDLHTETFEIVCKAPFRNTFLYNLNDNLCGIDIGHSEVIWSLNLEEKTWNKLYNIDLSKICPSFQECWSIVSPIETMGENNKLLLFNVSCFSGSIKKRLMIYDHETTSSHQVCTPFFSYAVCYFSSLISIL